jgi:Tfp pilus assembly protein PilF
MSAPDPRVELALELFQKAYTLQMQGELDLAEALYKRSIELHPTAEAYTFLGWTYKFQGKLDDAITECKNAILIDPGFGNPYNDIGAYLIELGQWDDAVPWFERAKQARRYEPRHYPHANLARVYAKQGKFDDAIRELRAALRLEPGYPPAQRELQRLIGMLN